MKLHMFGGQHLVKTILTVFFVLVLRFRRVPIRVAGYEDEGLLKDPVCPYLCVG